MSEQNKQEPVVTKTEKGIVLHVGWDDLPAGTKLYTTPPAAQPAPVQERPTDEQIIDVLLKARRAELEAGGVDTEGLRQEGVSAGWFLPYARAVISAFTPPAAHVQEPDWQARLTELQTVFKDVDQCGPLLGMGRPPAAQRQCENCGEFGICCQQQQVPLMQEGKNFTISKPWVGLTDEEVKKVHTDAGVTYLVPADYDRHLFTHMTDVQIMKVSRAIEAKLREKNGGAA